MFCQTDDSNGDIHVPQVLRNSVRNFDSPIVRYLKNIEKVESNS